jgi:hypothetical protein
LSLGLTPPPVGLNNHRQFIIFVTALVVGIILFDYLNWACECLLSIFPHLFTNILLPDFSSLEDSPTTSPTCFLPASVCRLTAIDMFLCCCRLVNPPAHLDPGATRFAVPPNRTSNDNVRGVQPRPIRLYGWAVVHSRRK